MINTALYFLLHTPAGLFCLGLVIACVIAAFFGPKMEDQ